MSKKAPQTYQKHHLEHVQNMLVAICGMQGYIPPTVLKLCGNAARIVAWHIKHSCGHRSPSGGPGKPPAST